MIEKDRQSKIVRTAREKALRMTKRDASDGIRLAATITAIRDIANLSGITKGDTEQLILLAEQEYGFFGLRMPFNTMVEFDEGCDTAAEMAAKIAYFRILNKGA